MPITFWIEKEKRRIRAEVFGTISTEDILNAIKGAINHPDFKPGYNILSDHTRINEAITKAQVLTTAFNLKDFAKYVSGAKWAVVTSKQVSYGMMNMLSVYLEIIPMKLQAFYSFADAEKWLEE